MVVPHKLKTLVPPIATAPAPVSQRPPMEDGEAREGCEVYAAAENRPVSPLPGSVPPQLEAVFQSEPAAPLQAKVADHASELPQEMVQANARPPNARQVRRTASNGSRYRPNSPACDCRL